MRIDFPTITARDLVERSDLRVVDLRSPGEHAEDHVPGAINVPLFDDVQRALVGTLYAQDSPHSAFEAAREIVRARIGDLVRAISAVTAWTPDVVDLGARVDALTDGGYQRTAAFLVGATTSAPPTRPIVFHCWRGGMRSRSVLHFVRELGLCDATLLDGGYKSYRVEVARRVASFVAPPTIALRGLTGVGKTHVLREIERIAPDFVVDLEALAAHRGSLLGRVGLEPRTQKSFESALVERLRRPLGPVMIVEGEARRIGDVTVPPSMWSAIDGAVNVELVASTERRVEVLVADYMASERSRGELRAQLLLVEARMSKKHVGPGLATLLDAGRVDELVRLLLEHYYDPLYRHAEKSKVYAHRIDATDPVAAAHACIALAERIAAGPAYVLRS